MVAADLDAPGLNTTRDFVQATRGSQYALLKIFIGCTRYSVVYSVAALFGCRYSVV